MAQRLANIRAACYRRADGTTKTEAEVLAEALRLPPAERNSWQRVAVSHAGGGRVSGRVRRGGTRARAWSASHPLLCDQQPLTRSPPSRSNPPEAQMSRACPEPEDATAVCPCCLRLVSLCCGGGGAGLLSGHGLPADLKRDGGAGADKPSTMTTRQCVAHLGLNLQEKQLEMVKLVKEEEWRAYFWAEVVRCPPMEALRRLGAERAPQQSRVTRA